MLADMINLQMAKTTAYSPSWPEQFDREASLAKTATYRLAGRLKKEGSSRFSAEIFSTLRRRPFSELISRISWTIKTHKPPTQVTCRVLHDASKSPLSSLSCFLDRQIAGELRKLPHIALNTSDLISGLSGLSVPKGSVIET